MSNKTIAIIDFGLAAIEAAIFYNNGHLIALLAVWLLFSLGLMHAVLAFREMKS